MDVLPETIGRTLGFCVGNGSPGDDMLGCRGQADIMVSSEDFGRTVGLRDALAKAAKRPRQGRRNLVSAKNSPALKAKRVERKPNTSLKAKRVERKVKESLKGEAVLSAKEMRLRARLDAASRLSNLPRALSQWDHHRCRRSCRYHRCQEGPFRHQRPRSGTAPRPGSHGRRIPAASVARHHSATSAAPAG